MLVLGCLALAGCSDGDPLLFPQPDAIQAVLQTDDPEITGQAGELLPSPVRIEVRDAYGNPIPDVSVRARVVAGGGSIETDTYRSNGEGFFLVNRWRMGESPGPNALEFESEAVDAVTVEVESGPGPPAHLEATGNDPEPTRVASTIVSLPSVRLTDQFGTPIPGETIQFAVSGDGSVAAPEAVTDEAGEAALPAWTLGPRKGEQLLSASHPSGRLARIRVEAEAGPPTTLAWTSESGTRAEAGMLLPLEPTVRVQDDWDNGIPGIEVEFELVRGEGSIPSTSATTDQDGLATPGGWTIDPVPGANEVEARVPGLPASRLLAEGMEESWEPEGRYFRVETLHVTQAAQRMDGTVPLIPGRPGLLRVFVQSTEPGAAAPPADVILYRNGVEFHRERVQPTFGTASTRTEEDGSSGSWDVMLDPEWIEPGLGVRVELDPDGEVGVVTRRFDRFPADGSIHEFERFRELPLLHVRFMVMRDAGSGTTADLSEDNVDDFMDFTRRVMPIASDSSYVAGTFTTNLYNGQGVVHTEALQSLLTYFRTTRDSIGDHYLHGIFPGDGPLSFAGVAYRPNDPANTAFQVGMTYDRLPGASQTVAHELGHNLGLPHAPCGDPDGPDPNFPYSNARLGVTGWDRKAETPFRSPTGHRDLMSYCGPRWISDYNYELVLEWRAVKPVPPPAPYVSAAAAATERILVSGMITADSVRLSPVLSTDAPPALPLRPGPFGLVGLDADGNRLFEYPFSPAPVSHAPDPTEAHFAFVLPISSADRTRLDRIEVRRPEAGFRAELRRRSGQSPDPISTQFSRIHELPGGIQAPEARVLRQAGPPGTGDRLEWDPEIFPTATVWSRDTGELVGMIHGGSLRLDLWDLDAVEIRLEDGLRSFEWRDGMLSPLH